MAPPSRQGTSIDVVLLDRELASDSDRGSEAFRPAARALIDALEAAGIHWIVRSFGEDATAWLHDTARRWAVPPQRIALVANTIAGIRAGAGGGCGLVIGIHSGTDPQTLRDAGADMVVSDPAELRLTAERRLEVKTLANLPSLWNGEAQLRKRLQERRPVLFLDYDGVLTPIVENYDQAVLSDAMRARLAALAAHLTVGIISGRDLDDLRRLVGLDTVFLAGSHGFEITGPHNWRKGLQRGEKFLPELDRAEQALHDVLAEVRGTAIERKRFSIAVHYRHVEDSRIGVVKESVARVLEDHRTLCIGRGKKVLEIQPRIDWNKGRAVRWLLEQLELEGPRVVPIYIGDDTTDEDAFRELADRGIAIAVGGDARRTAARWALRDPEDVGRFLDRLMAWQRQRP